MADVKSIAQSVDQAERDVYVPISEVQSLLDLHGIANTHAEVLGWGILARGAMERLVDAFEVYRQLLREQGSPAVDSAPIASKPAIEA